MPDKSAYELSLPLVGAVIGGAIGVSGIFIKNVIDLQRRKGTLKYELIQNIDHFNSQVVLAP